MAEEKDLIPRQRFSPLEKKRIISEIEQGLYTLQEAKSRYNIGHIKTLYSWVAIYAEDQSISGKRVRYSLSERHQAAADIITGKISKDQSVRKYGVSKEAIEVWLSDFAAKNPLMNEEKKQLIVPNDKEAKKQIEDLQLRIAALEALIDVAEQEYKLDIRKKCGTKQQ